MVGARPGSNHNRRQLDDNWVAFAGNILVQIRSVIGVLLTHFNTACE
jgi:hypothetical protein